jgi:hypothetical protein
MYVCTPAEPQKYLLSQMAGQALQQASDQAPLQTSGWV